MFMNLYTLKKKSLNLSGDSTVLTSTILVTFLMWPVNMKSADPFSNCLSRVHHLPPVINVTFWRKYCHAGNSNVEEKVVMQGTQYLCTEIV